MCIRPAPPNTVCLFSCTVGWLVVWLLDRSRTGQSGPRGCIHQIELAAFVSVFLERRLSDLLVNQLNSLTLTATHNAPTTSTKIQTDKKYLRPAEFSKSTIKFFNISLAYAKRCERVSLNRIECSEKLLTASMHFHQFFRRT